jgi:predicted enzyme related to lactoylglutathione lyase
MQPPMPDVPNHWHVYFAVPDADATAAQASAGGGQIAVRSTFQRSDDPRS